MRNLYKSVEEVWPRRDNESSRKYADERRKGDLGLMKTGAEAFRAAFLQHLLKAHPELSNVAEDLKSFQVPVLEAIERG